MTIFWIAAGGFLGAVLRYAIGKAVKHKYEPVFPVATLFVNLTGAFFLGVMIGAGLKGSSYAFAGIGFLGAFTTFSTFKVETLLLMQKGMKKKAVLYLGVSYICGLISATVGLIAGVSMA